MLDNYVLQADAFVDFLNEELSDDLKNTLKFHFKLENLRPRFLFGVGRQKIVLNNIYSSSVSLYNRNIERVADVLYSKEKTRHLSLAGFRKESWEKMRIDVVKSIELGHSKVIEPQNFILHQVSTTSRNTVYFEQLKGPRQLAYENRSWRFAD